MKLLDFASRDIGVDLGTANILVTLKGKGIVSREPSVVAVDITTGEIVKTGKEAKEMLGRTPENIKAIRPMRDGAIADFTATGLMIKNMIKKVCKTYNTGKPRLVVGVPSGITEVEERAVEETFFQCGAREVNLIDEPMASAIGAGLNVLEPNGKMIVDIGGGTAEVAVISLGGIVASTSIKVAGNTLDEAIANYLKRALGLVISLETAENLKIDLGCAEKLVTELTKDIRGRDLDSGLPKNVTITSTQIANAMRKPVSEIVEAIANTLSNTPPELVADIMENGIYLAGGGALIRSLDNLIAQKIGVQTYTAETPLDCVAIGTGKILEDIEKYKPVFIERKSRRK
ncbi:MAG: rod shape-determining protein [Clostridia bacterium]|nr:rod shape-determining protein [Clostridia bacterium]